MWEGVTVNTPFRFTRWCVILGLVIWRWATGLPTSAVGWWPVLFLAVVLLLPDTASISLAASGIQLRETAKKVEAGEALGVMQAGAVAGGLEPPVPVGAAADELLKESR